MEFCNVPRGPSPTSDSSDSASESGAQADSSDFQMNSRLEVMDFNEKWSVLRVYYSDHIYCMFVYLGTENKQEPRILLLKL